MLDLPVSGLPEDARSLSRVRRLKAVRAAVEQAMAMRGSGEDHP